MIDWASTLKLQVEFAAIARKKVNAALSQCDLTFTEASRVQQSVDKSAKAYERVRQQLAADLTADDSLLEAADHLKKIWSGMMLDTENLIREMLGLRIMPPRRVANDG